MEPMDLIRDKFSDVFNDITEVFSKRSAPEIEPDDIDVSDTITFTWEIK